MPRESQSNLALDVGYISIIALVASPWGLAFFGDDFEKPCAVQSKKPPRASVVAVATAANLPSSHDGLTFLRCAHRMNFDNAALTGPH